MGANPMIRDTNRWTALHHCAAGGCGKTTEALLAYHSSRSIEAADQDGNTALHVAAKHGHVSVIELILLRGADITVRNKQRLTCLDVAVECRKEKVAEVLIEDDRYVLCRYAKRAKAHLCTRRKVNEMIPREDDIIV